MKSFKLEDIEKKDQPFTVPEGYFEDLPMKIQAKVEARKKKWSWIYQPRVQLAFSMAMIVLIIGSIFYVNSPKSVDDMLANVSQEDLLAYVDMMQLEDGDILAAFEGSIESIDFSESLENIELEDASLDAILNEYDLSEEYL